jgi:hypothetical protein
MASLAWAFCLFITLFTMYACVSLTPEGKQVRLTSNPNVVQGCAFLGNVKACSGWGHAVGGETLNPANTEKSMQNQTAALGGNVLSVVTTGAYASGEAYQCESSSVPPHQ